MTENAGENTELVPVGKTELVPDLCGKWGGEWCVNPSTFRCWLWLGVRLRLRLRLRLGGDLLGPAVALR